MAYFADNYCEIKYPVAHEDKPGLRNAQLGGIHAIASYNTLQKRMAGIVVMPTGSGKTSVLMMTPYIVSARKVLIVTPSIMVRGQIYDDFNQLRTLKRAHVFGNHVAPPSTFELKTKYSEDVAEIIDNADVIIATPQCGLSISESEKKEAFDLVLIDEAHHVPAPTWQQILINMKEARQYLFTATPFRLDKKEIKGEILYSYPLSMAYHDGIFGEIQYMPIDEAPDKDLLIAREAERVFENDRQQGMDHYLMVRTDTKKNAQELESIYADATKLKLRRVDSSMTHKAIEKCIGLLREKEIDGIICVDMLGEGFDFPNLKIAAIHAPHKSLASTLQFIGRFARTNSENIGSAKFIAMNDEALSIENYKLYQSDSIWQEIIVDMSEGKIHQEEAIRKNIIAYERADEFTDEGSPISLHNIRPNCHAKVYRISAFNINASFPDVCKVDDSMVFRNYSDNTVVGIGMNKIKPKWSATEQIVDIENLLYIVHFQKKTSLLFIYSQIKSEIDYELIAESFTTEYKKIPRNKIHRVLGKMKDFEMFNTGMQNRYAESGESYRIHAGSNVASSIDATTGRMFSAGHVFCKAISEINVPVTIGYSSGSKIWSSSYQLIPEYVAWCDENGAKIANESMSVQTNTNYDFMPLPAQIDCFPQHIFYCFFSDKTYTSPPVIYKKNGDISNELLIDAEVVIQSISDKVIELKISILDMHDFMKYSCDGSYTCDNPTIFVKDGRHRVSLADYLSDYPMLFKTTDDTVFDGSEVYTGVPDAILFSSNNVLPIDWDFYSTNIRKEEGTEADGKKSIHSALYDMLAENNDFDYLLYDHGSGEIADYITILETDHTIEVVFYHVKSMHGQNFNSDVNDIYEVTQQAIKSTIWLKSKGTLLDKIRSRRKSRRCEMKKGEMRELTKTLKQSKLFTAKMVIVQPAISKGTDFPEKYQQVLASANYYISSSGRITKLTIWGSK